jgi:DNA topoisomerase-6 subunit B
MKLALSECGRKLKIYLSRRAKMRRQTERRDVFHRYIEEVVNALHSIDSKLVVKKMLNDFTEVAKQKTMEADTQFDEDGNLVKQELKRDVLAKDETTIIVEDAAPPMDDDDEIQQELFD